MIGEFGKGRLMDSGGSCFFFLMISLSLFFFFFFLSIDIKNKNKKIGVFKK